MQCIILLICELTGYQSKQRLYCTYYKITFKHNVTIITRTSYNSTNIWQSSRKITCSYAHVNGNRSE